MPERLDLSYRGGWFSLSLRERVGVRGKETSGLERGSGKFHAVPESGSGSGGLRLFGFVSTAPKVPHG
jgi:hypothetical protein